MSIYSQVPTTPDAFTRIMAELYYQNTAIKRNRAFQAFFGNGANGSQSLFTDDALAVDIEIMKDDSYISALHTRGVQPALSATADQGQKMSHTSRVFPISKEVAYITAQDVAVRGFGETPVDSARSKYMRYLAIAAQKFNAKINGAIWLFERLASQAILTGKMDSDAFGGEFDFRRNPDNTTSAANLWTDQTNGKPLDDLDELATLVEENGQANPDFAGMDVDSYDALIEHDSVSSKADNRRYHLVEVGTSDKLVPGPEYQRYIDGGWVARAYVTTKSGYKLWIFTYKGWYRDADKNKVAFLPKGNVFVTSTDARFDRYFGPDDKMPEELSAGDNVLSQSFGIGTGVIQSASDVMNGADAIVDPRQFRFFAFPGLERSGVKLEVQCAPIFAPVQVDATAVMTGTVV